MPHRVYTVCVRNYNRSEVETLHVGKEWWEIDAYSYLDPHPENPLASEWLHVATERE